MFISWQEMQKSARLVYSIPMLTPPQIITPMIVPTVSILSIEHFGGLSRR